ncbi:GNAT family N-acetyltransferase [Sediminibacillus massiliensis]|uniref:GNAT family N-acetyltransferase n=1 Tax=Sediminibacillus massiliensis TaxID=1926277 RepID=UPI0015C2C74E|nr:GNAT family N-acetyltransferase [Sediminibacillus massiliensis]
MEVLLNSNPEDFCEKAEPLLLPKEACNNLALGLLNRLKENVQGPMEAKPYLGMVKKKGELIYIFLQTPPNNLILPEVANADEAVYEKIAEYLHKQGIVIPGVLGPKKAALAFATHWRKLTGEAFEVHMEQLIYRLESVSVRAVDKGRGSLKRADKEHQNLIMKWLVLFGQEAGEPILEVQAEKMADNFISTGSCYLWMVDHNPVAMVNQSRKSKNGVTINGVYTPNEHKRKGYATAAVAALSQQLLDQGYSFCSLYTDKSNPTSNSIYSKIGYQPVGESIVYQFQTT